VRRKPVESIHRIVDPVYAFLNREIIR
jgi:hypothetical protein